MKYSLDIAKKFISINDDTNSISDNLILKTVEVEKIEKRVINQNIVIWKIFSVEKHPDADKLNICMVDCGKKWKYQIICGWINVENWIYVPTALVWTFFPKHNIKIEARKMRWVESNGMICSKEELDIKEDLDLHRIWNLWSDFDDLSDDDLGFSLAEKYPWLESKIIDVDNKWLTNRPDLTWHFGLAVELNSIYSDDKISYNKVKDYFETFKSTKILDILENKEKTKIGLKNETDKLNTYILMEINNVDVKKSSFFTRLQMLDLGNIPRWNWVDFSNLFMNIAGQPIHFFDADKVKWNIIVRQAKKWEKFVDLFEKEHELLESDILIADDEKILALAWVVWWLNSGVSENTKNILVEIANFDPVSVRKTWVRLWLRTDAELRYEKNINPNYSLYSLLLFMDILWYYKKDLWDYDLWWLSFYTKNNNINYIQTNIDIDYDKLMNFVFGENKEWFENKAKEILIWLWFVVDWNKVWVPFWRSPDDINIVEDLYEEIARIYWYNNIQEKPIKSDVVLPKTSSLVNLVRELEEIFVRDFNFNQVETYPWIWKSDLEDFDVNLENLYKIKNPIDSDKPYLRSDLDNILTNYIYKNSKFFDNFKIFDIGKVWNKWNAKNNLESRFANDVVWERLQLSAMYYKNSNKNRSDDLILFAKWQIQYLLQKKLWLDLTLEYRKTKKKSYHPKKQWEIIYDWVVVWFLWSLHPIVLKNHRLWENDDLVYLSLDLEKINEAKEKLEFKPKWYETLQDQIIWRDLCFVLDEKNDYGEVLNLIKNVEWVSDMEVFDLYKWDNLPSGKKSVALKIKIKWEKMDSEYINNVMKNTIKIVEKSWAKLRD